MVPRFESKGSFRIRDFMINHVAGFETLEDAADAIAEYLPYRKRTRNLEGLKKNLRHRDGRWYWHWDPAFVTQPGDDAFVEIEKLEREAMAPTAEFVELADAGHTAAGDDNDAFSEAVVAFVTTDR